MRGKGRGNVQADVFSGKWRNEFQRLCVERLSGQDQRGSVFLGERTRCLTEEQRVVGTVQLVAQHGIPQ